MVSVGRKKKRISATVEPELKDRLDALTEINVSKLIESLLKEYLAQGESTTVALHLLRDDLRRKRDNKQLEKRLTENEIQSLDEQIEEVTAKIRERREAGLEGTGDIVAKVKAGELSATKLDEKNPIIRDYAGDAGVPPERYADELADRLDGEEWEVETQLSIAANRVTFDKERWAAGEDPVVAAATDGGQPEGGNDD